jgi:hypothetical protein
MNTITNPLTMEDLKQLVPSAFTNHKHQETSDRYVHMSTEVVIQDLMKLGWVPVKAKEIRARKRKGYQKHLIVFQHSEMMIKDRKGDDSFIQILLTNSHDGKNAFVFKVGIFRLICENGLVICDNDFGNIAIRHFGYSFEELQKTIQELINKLPILVKKFNKFTRKKLVEEQIKEFAIKAAKIRGTDNVDVNELIKPTRKLDEGNSLWAVYNRIQEKLIKGNFTYGNKNRKARAIKNFQQDMKVNEEMFELASSYL